MFSSRDDGRIALDSPREDALIWLAQHRPLYLPHAPDVVCRVRDVRRFHGDRHGARGRVVATRRGEAVALTGLAACCATTLALIAAGLACFSESERRRRARAPPICRKDPGRHLVTERVLRRGRASASSPETARLTLARLGLAQHEERHPRDLSSGDREWLALATVLARPSPSSWCSTGPPGGVDPERKQEALHASSMPDAPARGTLGRHTPRPAPWAAEVAGTESYELPVRENVRALGSF